MLIRPFRQFARTQAAGGIMLLGATAIALFWSNSRWAESYDALWSETTLTVGLPQHALSLPLGLWINDLLMALFFLLVGLEVKREILVGELASLRKAALPVIAAAGGMIVPGVIYALCNVGQGTMAGWGIPVATDIAFALGVLALFGPRIPVGLKVFLASLAIADDIGALLVIALFYTEHLHANALLISAGLVGLLFAMNGLGFRKPGLYMAVGAVLWLFVHESGVHATIAGVVVALTIPARSRVNVRTFVDHGRQSLESVELEQLAGVDRPVLTSPHLVGVIDSIDHACKQVTTPLQRLEHALEPWVAFLIVPLFALANAGISISTDALGALNTAVLCGVVLGLVVGKPLGITIVCRFAVRLGLASLPSGVSWTHLLGASFLAGIGFTMSLFITYLAFADPHHVAAAKFGVLLASFLAALGGTAVLMRSWKD